MATHASFTPEDDTPVFVISVAAELADMHAQTLRQYDRIGLVVPARTRGGGRRYSARDVARLREVQRLSQEGISLTGIQRILDLEDRAAAMRTRIADLEAQLERMETLLGLKQRFFAVGPTGDIVALRHGQRPAVDRSQALVRWDPRRAWLG